MQKSDLWIIREKRGKEGLHQEFMGKLLPGFYYEVNLH